MNINYILGKNESFNFFSLVLTQVSIEFGNLSVYSLESLSIVQWDTKKLLNATDI